MDKNYTNQIEKVNTLGGDLNVLEKRIYELESNIIKSLDTIQTESALKLVNIEKELILNAQDKLLRFTEGFDQTEKLINSEFENVKKTTKNFNEFISEETSIKLTNNFKDKAAIERNWYYGFNGASVIIIIIAIVMSYTSLTNFADNHAKNFTQLDLYYLAIRLLFSFLIFSTVAFTNKLANKHYYHWKKNESTYLKLTALKSFIADMSPEKQQEIHEKLIDVYFGKEDLDPTIYKKMDSSSTDLIKFLTDKGIGLVSSKKTD